MHSRVHIQKRRTDDPIWLLPDLLPYLAARLGAQPSARADMYPPSWYLSFAMLNLDRLLWKIPVLHRGVQALHLGTLRPNKPNFFWHAIGGTWSRTWSRHIPLFVFLTFSEGLVFLIVFYGVFGFSFFWCFRFFRTLEITI